MENEEKEILQDIRQTLDAMCDVLVMLCERDREREKQMLEYFSNAFSSTSNHKHRQIRLKKIREGHDG